MLALDPATVQAWSAVVVACLTAVLVWATWQYVRKTQLLADQAKRTNDLAAASLERSLRLDAPSLVVEGPGTPDPGQMNDPQATVTQEIRIANTGRTDAYHVIVDTTWEEVELLDEPIAAGSYALLHVTVPLASWGQDPAYVLRFRFVDRGGSAWFQIPGDLPHLLPSRP